MERFGIPPQRPAFDEHKATEAASILLELSSGEMQYMKLLKLLYLADRRALQLWERPITFDRYASLDQGPVLSNAYDIIKSKAVDSGDFWSEFIVPAGRYRVQLRGDPPKMVKLSSAEIDVLREVFKEFGGWDQWKLVEYTHQLPEYKDPHGSSIPIELDAILSALSYSARDIARIGLELEEEASVDRILGA